jgi:hypothetical protein
MESLDQRQKFFIEKKFEIKTTSEYRLERFRVELSDKGIVL